MMKTKFKRIEEQMLKFRPQSRGRIININKRNKKNTNSNYETENVIAAFNILQALRGC